MKHVKCKTCGSLIRPGEWHGHYSNCTGNKVTPSSESDDKSPSKRRKTCHVEEEEEEREKICKNTVPNECKCSKCGKTFGRKYERARHERTCDGVFKTKVTVCGKCRKTFSDYRTRLRHEKTCENKSKPTQTNFSCYECNKAFKTGKALVQHQNQSRHNKASSSTSSLVQNKTKNKTHFDKSKSNLLTCRICQDHFTNSRSLYEHRMLYHKQSSNGSLQNDPWSENDENTAPWVDADESVDESMRREYDLHRHLILRERVQEGDVRNTYNFPVPNLSNLDQLIDQVEFIFEHNQTAFKVNLSFGLILRNIENGTYRYFVPYYIDGLFLFPQLINNRNDIEKLRRRLSELDITNYFEKQKPNSKWKPVVITNVLYHVHKTSFPLGLSKPLPNYIVKSKSIISFEKNPNTKLLYDDDLCFFRCLAYHKTRNINCETMTTELQGKWVNYIKENKLKSTDVTLCRMPDLELCFEININVFELNKEKTVTSLYKSRECFPSDTMNLNLFEDHLSYVSKFKSYARKFQCRLCEKLFNTKCNLVRHEITCENATKLRFPGGYFESAKTIFDKLKDIGINVESSLQNYPWFVTFDLEAMLKQTNEQNSDLLTKTSRHEPISVSICSNVNGFTSPKFILDENLESLLTQMIGYMNEISDKTYLLAQERWAHVFIELEKLESKWGLPERRISVRNDNGDADNDDDNGVVDDDDDDDDDENDDDDIGCEAKESSECEPPSADFLYAMSKKNVWHSLLKNLESTNEIRVEYNEWDKQSIKSTFNSTNSSSGSSNGSCNSSDNDGDNDKDDDSSRCSSCNSSSSSSIYRDDYNENDDDHDLIQPFCPLNPRSSSSIESDDDDDDIHPPKRNYRRIESDDDADDDDDYRTFPETSKLMIKLIKRTREQFETYCHQVPVLGFNSAKYDLNLLKSHLARHLRLHEPKQQKFVVKRNNAYMCLSNQTLKFLDMVNYLPPATSYDKFLATFGVAQRKSYFPYEYFTDIAVLEESSLPPKEAFYSSLKRCNVLEHPKRVSFEKLIKNENKTEAEALSILNLDSPPKSTIDENYHSLLQTWEKNNMLTFRDFLEHYNNLDVLPMVEGVQKFKSYFVERGVDIFKDCISVPGAARKMLYQSGFQAGAEFALISRQDEDMYHSIKSNIIGGPSIIFTRYQEAGQTFIRNNEKLPCQSVLGYDANSLYVYALSQPMPCGNYVRRKKEHKFKPEKTFHRFTVMHHWMAWLNHSQTLNIQHKMNSGSEKRIGPYLVDGYDPDTGMVYEYLGCYFHGHSCINPQDMKTHEERLKRTDDRMAFIKSMGYDITSIWECAFWKQVNENDEMKGFIDKRYPEFYRNHKGRVKESEIIDAIVTEKLFGFIEVDIQVPDSWDQVVFKQNTELNPYEYFEEMCPLFCTSEVDFDFIGEHMQQHAQNHGLSTKPRTLLVGGIKAECLLVSTPLLKWYIEHGLLVTNIHQIIEFSKLSCFKDFVDNVTTDRRQGDIDKSQELKSSLSKLVGVSAFGGTIINQEKFQKITYVKGHKKACFAINNPRFRQLTELGDDMFETELAQARISLNSPMYLGYMILQYAKLHMLSFYYDFLLKFVGRNSFEMSEMDTDSCYFGLGTRTLQESIKPEMLSIFNKNILGNCRNDFAGDNFNTVWFPRECCQTHNKHDLRTPGLMKLEFSGTQIIGLSSKSYIAINDEENKRKVKYSLKGVNNQFVEPSDSFKRVLDTQEPVTANNKGIKSFNNTMFTYIQPKLAFNYFYCKRLVLPDGVHTKPLDIVLKPINKYKQSLQEEEDNLNNYIHSLTNSM